MPDNQQENQTSRPRRRCCNYGRLIPGSLLLFFGVVFLLNNYGIISGDVWGKLWPLFLIIPGLLILFGPGKDERKN